MFQLPAGRLGLRHWRKVHLNTNCPSRSAKILLQKTKTQLVQETTTHCKYLLQIHCSQFSNIDSKCHFHNDGLLSDFSYFLDFFLYRQCTGSKLYAHRISGSTDQPSILRFLGNFVANITDIFVTKINQLCIIYKRSETN